MTSLVDRVFESPPSPFATTQALLLEQGGNVLVERYGAAFDADSTFISWSMAKSMISALCGMLIADGLLELDAPAAIAEWRNDARSEITLRHLLLMRSGLQWDEDYVNDEVSDVIKMLFREARRDVAGYAIAKPLAHAPGTEWLYSSGTSNIISRIVGDVVAGDANSPSDRKAAMQSFMSERLFAPLGMTSAAPKFDAMGTFIASSFVFATARDFAAFGRLFADEGQFAGKQILSPEWVAESTGVQSTCPETGQGYSMQWWAPADRPDRFSANGYEGQMTLVAPDVDAVLVRLGKTPDLETNHAQLRSLYAEMLECL